jgi:hypothetical protein
MRVPEWGDYGMISPDYSLTVGRNKQPRILPELRSRHRKTILQSSYTARNLGCAVPANALRDLVPAYMNNPG